MTDPDDDTDPADLSYAMNDIFSRPVTEGGILGDVGLDPPDPED